MGDPGGTGEKITGPQEINKDVNGSATAGNKNRPNDNNTVPLTGSLFSQYGIPTNFPDLEVTYLPKIGSDRCPLMLKYDIEAAPVKKSFRFLNFWIKHESFKEVVKGNWNADFYANPFVLFNYKLKKLKKALTVWIKATYGDIFQKIESLEEVVMVHEAQFEVFPTQENRERLQKVQADMIKYLAIEEEFWKQKVGMQWFKEGDRNTKFFPAHVNGRTKKLQIKRIQNNTGAWIEQDEEIAEVAPNKEKVKKAVLGLNGESAGGPDGFIGCFYQFCWDIIGDDIYDMEIITDIRLRTKAGPNVVIKLDMAKAYDRLSWLFLTKVMRKMGFDERFIGMVFGIVSNNWYSILINGQPFGFFKSTRGVKQGNPLSPTLFILAVEALSRGLNSLHLNLYFCGYGMPKWSPKINHLAYADDTIIFSSSDATSLRLVMEVLNAYEVASVPQVFRIDESIRNVNDVVEDGMWNVEKIQEALPMEFAMHILERIKPQ
ncbi:uncharacterized protein LOC142170174 [Nicotiana tabacum]|uniref:Uncharacterized protein LOC142170174 n=1 Tax=Nicotiana tabacum TaxID=4097 RepID=A0AC58SSZ9_TOBAC